MCHNFFKLFLKWKWLPLALEYSLDELCVYCKLWLCISQSIVEYLSMFCRHVLLSLFLMKGMSVWRIAKCFYLRLLICEWIVQTIFSCTYTVKRLFCWHRGPYFKHLSGVPDLLSRTIMEIVKFSVYYLDEYTVYPFSKLHFFLSKSLCVWCLVCTFDGGFIAFPLYKRRLFYCRVLHRLHLQYIMVIFHKTLELCSLDNYFQNW